METIFFILALSNFFVIPFNCSTLDLLNHKWDNTCPIYTNQLLPPQSYPNAIGACPAYYGTIDLPPNFKPNQIFTAWCSDECVEKLCSRKNFYECRTVTKLVNVITSLPDLPYRSFPVAEGCLCIKTPNATLAVPQQPDIVQ